MRNAKASNSAPRRRKRIRVTLLLCASLPLLLFAVLYFAYYLPNNQPVTLIVPTHSVPEVNGLDDFKRAGKLAQSMPHKFAQALQFAHALHFSKSLPASPAVASKDAAPALALMRLGLKKPCVNPPMRTAVPVGQLTSSYELWELAHVVVGEADYQAASGHPYLAAMTRLDGYEMGVMLANQGNLYAESDSSFCQKTSLTGFEKLLPSLSPSELAQVAARLDQIETKRISYGDVLLEESYIDAAQMKEVINNPQTSPLQTAVQIFGQDPFDSQKSTMARLQYKTFTARNICRYMLLNKEALVKDCLETGRLASQWVRKPYIRAAKIDERKYLLPGLYDPNSLVKLWLMGFPQHVQADTYARLIRTEVALYRCKAAKGQFPDQLSLLTPLYLPSVPEDPFGGGAGHPLRYKSLHKGADFLLYSVGADNTDDGGTPAQDLLGVGDIVARKMLGMQISPVPGLSN